MRLRFRSSSGSWRQKLDCDHDARLCDRLLGTVSERICSDVTAVRGQRVDITGTTSEHYSQYGNSDLTAFEPATRPRTSLWWRYGVRSLRREFSPLGRVIRHSVGDHSPSMCSALAHLVFSTLRTTSSGFSRVLTPTTKTMAVMIEQVSSSRTT